jgi:hypothetical protein
VEVPSLFLGVVPEWIEAHCVIPDQDHRGEPFRLGDEQLVFVARHYAVRSSALVGQKAEAFTFRRSQLVRAQKWGKSPLVAAFVCAEGVGPVLFDGFARRGDAYDCAEHGCRCGWGYDYEPGEPMGAQWSTPLIQITATSEDQTDNTYDALRPMIELGPLVELIPKTGEEFIRLPNGGRIDAVTSQANSRLGQRITFAAQDETGLWLQSNGGHKLAKTQRRGLAGMGGRSIETTNSWDPSQDSVAQRTHESAAADINKDFQQPPADLDFAVKEDRAKIFAVNYKAAPWVSQASVEAEAAELMEKDPTDAERFFGNRIVAGQGHWLTEADWAAKTAVQTVAPRTRVCLGFDGSDNDDFTGIRLETLDFFQFTPTYGNGRKTLWRPQDWNGRIPRDEVRAAVDQIMSEFDVVRAYCDPHMWGTEIDEWAGRYGDKVFLKWPTFSLPRMWPSLDRFKTDLTTPMPAGLRHDADPDVATHARNAIVRARDMDKLTGRRQYILGKPNEHQKFDYLMSSVLAHEAVCDAIADGANAAPPDNRVIVFR